MTAEVLRIRYERSNLPDTVKVATETNHEVQQRSMNEEVKDQAAERHRPRKRRLRKPRPESTETTGIESAGSESTEGEGSEGESEDAE